MPKGGTLTIEAKQTPMAAQISIADTGEGISAENRDRIFTPLFTTKAKGRGFGLPVCERIIEAHNGKIWFESEAGKGTCFIVELPAAHAAT